MQMLAAMKNQGWTQEAGYEAKHREEEATSDKESVRGQRTCSWRTGFRDNNGLINQSISFNETKNRLGLQTFGVPTFGLLPHLSVWDRYTSNFCSSKSILPSIPNYTYTIISFYQFRFH